MTAAEALSLIESGAEDRVGDLSADMKAARQYIDAKIVEAARRHTSTVVSLVIETPHAARVLNLVLRDLHADGYRVYLSELEPVHYLDISWGNLH